MTAGTDRQRESEKMRKIVMMDGLEEALVAKFTSQGDDFWDPMTVQASDGTEFEIDIDYEPDREYMGLYANVKGPDGYESHLCADMDISDCEECDPTEFAERYFRKSNQDFCWAVDALADYIKEDIEIEDISDEDL